MSEVASAFVSLVPSAKGFGRSVDSQIGPDLDKSGVSGGKRFGSGFASAAKSLIGPAIALVGVAAVGGFLKDSIAEAREAQKVGAQTAAVIKSTGGAANVTAKQFGTLATAISNKTGIDDEDIQSGENMLATFTNIRNGLGKNNDIFTQATKVATDLGVATKTGPTQASLLLGKALNDPAKGLSRLTKIGVTFTDQQKDQVAALVKSGDTMGAQKIILKELAKEFGGSAEAQATAGEKLKVAFGNFKEQIGTALLPIIDKLENVLTSKVIPAVSGFIVQLQDGTGAGGKVADIFAQVGAVLSTVFSFISNNKAVVAAFAGTILGIAVAVGVLNAVLAINPFTLLVLAIAGLVAGLVYAYIHFDTFRTVVQTALAAVQTAFTTVFAYIQNIVSTTIAVVTSLWGTFGSTIVSFIQDAFQAIVQIVSGQLEILKGVFDVFASLFSGDWQGVWDGLQEIVAGFWKALSGIVDLAWAALTTQFKLAGEAIAKVFGGIWSDIKTIASDGIKSLVDAVAAVPGKLLGLLSKFKDAGKSLVEGLIHGLSNAGSAASDFANTIWQAVKSVINSGIDRLNALLEFTVAIPGAPDIHVNPPNIGHLFRGTSNWRGGPTWVGERGPELLNLPRGSQVIPNNKIGDVGPMAGSGATSSGFGGIDGAQITIVNADYMANSFQGTVTARSNRMVSR